MDDSTKFLIKRMDQLEGKLLKEIKEIQRETLKLQYLKNKAIGFIIGVSFVISSTVELVFRKLGG